MGTLAILYIVSAVALIYAVTAPKFPNDLGGLLMVSNIAVGIALGIVALAL